MSVPMLNAYVEGYEQRLLDQRILGVMQGHWSAYFQSKHPKSAATIIETMQRSYKKARDTARGVTVKKPDVDVDQFLAREQRLQQTLHQRK